MHAPHTRKRTHSIGFNLFSFLLQPPSLISFSLSCAILSLPPPLFPSLLPAVLLLLPGPLLQPTQQQLRRRLTLAACQRRRALPTLPATTAALLQPAIQGRQAWQCCLVPAMLESLSAISVSSLMRGDDVIILECVRQHAWQR